MFETNKLLGMYYVQLNILIDYKPHFETNINNFKAGVCLKPESKFVVK